ncbi:hypothetical protein C8A05DRAFT_20319 [Staphylotrichum tortipilum]|uniref:DUF6590 domain-containing protein n=1 Tax=Staphylotrichum tortipilum TaxID=2831512 RepID=A0AAN6MAF7_9PEZI|nr:hypothetical protein C8A05DRAFT_20319 [Staphylotrichum longicolle]
MLNLTGYRTAHSSEFMPGEIFKIIWTEPVGTRGRSDRSEVPTNASTRFDESGTAFYQGIRRFIVVANDEGHCTAVPILTYERQGCKKRGVKPLKHGIIHQKGRQARPLPEEPKLGFPPVRAELYERTENLVKESRVNYAKLQTIEHNVPVLFIGRIDPEDFDSIVLPAIDRETERRAIRRSRASVGTKASSWF